MFSKNPILILDIDGTITKKERYNSIFDKLEDRLENIILNNTELFLLIEKLISIELTRFLISKILLFATRYIYPGKENRVTKILEIDQIKQIKNLAKNHGIKIIALTNSNKRFVIRSKITDIDNIIKIFYLKAIGIPKPSTIVLKKIIKIFSSSLCIYIGDSVLMDIIPSKFVGCITIWINSNKKRYIHPIIIKKIGINTSNFEEACNIMRKIITQKFMIRCCDDHL